MTAVAVAPPFERVRAGSVARRAAVVLAFLYLALVVLAASDPRLLSAQNPLAIGTGPVLQPPSAAHWFGTDENGRDIYSRVVYGARSALELGFGATLISLVVGTVIGSLSALGGRLVDGVFMRLADVGLAFPELLLALIVITMFGPGTFNALLAIGVAGIPSYARLVRAETLTIRNCGYVVAARGLGTSSAAVVLRHVVPNAVRPVLVLATIGVGTATVAGASLSFLGLGTPPPAPSWGSMLSTAQNFIGQSWTYALFPGLAITGLVLSMTVVGHWLRERTEGQRASW